MITVVCPHLVAVDAAWDDGPDPGRWIADRLGPFGPSVGHAVPLGYAAHAVVPIPADEDDFRDLYLPKQSPTHFRGHRGVWRVQEVARRRRATNERSRSSEGWSDLDRRSFSRSVERQRRRIALAAGGSLDDVFARRNTARTDRSYGE